MGELVRVEVVDGARTRKLRRAVLRPHLPSDAPLPGDELTVGVHLAALHDDGTVIGTCFLYPDPCPWLPERGGAWRLRQMATADGHRGRGVGGAVVRAAIAQATAHGAPLLWCNAREPAVAFYRRHGFGTHGGGFIEHEMPHRHMWRELSG